MRDTIDGINEKAWEAAMAKTDDVAGTIERLDCGHPESAHSSITRGYAILPNGTKVCYGCAQRQELDDLKTAQHYGGYLSRVEMQGLQITGWVGWKLATVTQSSITTLSAFGTRHSRVYFRAIDVHGNHWYGNSPGVGMYARMHRAKPTKTRKRDRTCNHCGETYPCRGVLQGTHSFKA